MPIFSAMRDVTSPSTSVASIMDKEFIVPIARGPQAKTGSAMPAYFSPGDHRTILGTLAAQILKFNAASGSPLVISLRGPRGSILQNGQVDIEIPASEVLELKTVPADFVRIGGDHVVSQFDFNSLFLQNKQSSGKQCY